MKLYLTNPQVAALATALEFYLENTTEPDEDAETVLEMLESDGGAS